MSYMTEPDQQELEKLALRHLGQFIAVLPFTLILQLLS